MPHFPRLKSATSCGIRGKVSKSKLANKRVAVGSVLKKAIDSTIMNRILTALLTAIVLAQSTALSALNDLQAGRVAER